MKTFANIIKNKEAFTAWAASNKYQENERAGFSLIIVVENIENIYRQYENLGRMCQKAYKKYGGLDLDYLANCSILKSITRAARVFDNTHGGRLNMAEDRAARVALAGRLWLECVNA